MGSFKTNDVIFKGQTLRLPPQHHLQGVRQLCRQVRRHDHGIHRSRTYAGSGMMAQQQLFSLNLA